VTLLLLTACLLSSSPCSSSRELQLFGRPEVGHLGLLSAIQQHIGRLQIPVDHVAGRPLSLVQVLHALGNPLDYLQPPLPIQQRAIRWFP